MHEVGHCFPKHADLVRRPAMSVWELDLAFFLKVRLEDTISTSYCWPSQSAMVMNASSMRMLDCVGVGDDDSWWWNPLICRIPCAT